MRPHTSSQVRVRAPASSANLGPGFDVLAVALDRWLQVEGREAPGTSIAWTGIGRGEVPLDTRNLIVRGAQEPFRGWSRPLAGLALRVRNAVPIGRGLGSSAAALVTGILLGARLRGLRITPQRVLELALPLEGHGDNLAAALFGGFCVVAVSDGGVQVHRLRWPVRWRLVCFVPEELSPTHEARRLVPARPARADAVFNLGRVAEWVLACTRADGTLLASATQDRLHQPARAQAYPYLDEAIAAAMAAGALGATLSGAGGSVIAIVDRQSTRVGGALADAARRYRVGGRVLSLRATQAGASIR